jgi:hypothetical protein
MQTATARAYASTGAEGSVPVEADAQRLLVLNIVLQAFDGLATYEGLRLGFEEANPVLLAAFDRLGVAASLLLFKLVACGLLFLLHRTAPPAVRLGVMRMLAAVYCVLSLAPWLAKFLSMAASLA